MRDWTAHSLQLRDRTWRTLKYRRLNCLQLLSERKFEVEHILMTAHIISNSSVWDMAWYIISFNAALSTNMSSVWDIIWRAFSIADSTMESPIRDWTRKVIHVSLISYIPSVRDRVWRAAPMAAPTANSYSVWEGVCKVSPPWHINFQ